LARVSRASGRNSKGGYSTPSPRIERSKSLSKRSCEVLPFTAVGDIADRSPTKQNKTTDLSSTIVSDQVDCAVKTVGKLVAAAAGNHPQQNNKARYHSCRTIST